MDDNYLIKEGIDFLLKGLRYFHPETVTSALALTESEVQKYKTTTSAQFDSYLFRITQVNDLIAARDILIYWGSLEEQKLYSNLPVPIIEALKLTADVSENGDAQKLEATKDLDEKLKRQPKAIPIPRSVSKIKPKTPGVVFQPQETIDGVVYQATNTLYLKKTADSVEPLLTPLDIKRLAGAIYRKIVVTSKEVLKDSVLNEQARAISQVLAASFRRKILEIEDHALGVNVASIAKALANQGELSDIGLSAQQAKQVAKAAIEIGLVASKDTMVAKRYLTPVLGRNIVNAFYGSGIKLEITNEAEEADFVVDLAKLTEVHDTLSDISRQIFGETSSLLQNQRYGAYMKTLVSSLVSDRLTLAKTKNYLYNMAATIFFHAATATDQAPDLSLEERDIQEFIEYSQEYQIIINQPLIDRAQDKGFQFIFLSTMAFSAEGRKSDGISDIKEIAEFKKQVIGGIKQEIKAIVKSTAKEIWGSVKNTVLTKIWPAIMGVMPEIMTGLGIALLLAPIAIAGGVVIGEYARLFAGKSTPLFDAIGRWQKSSIEGFRSGLSRIGPAFRTLFNQASHKFIKIAMYALIAVIFMVAVILFIINSGAYVVPRQSLGSITTIPPGGNLTVCDPLETGADITQQIASSIQAGWVYLLPTASGSRQEGLCMTPTMIILHTSGGYDNDAGNSATYSTLVTNNVSCQMATDTDDTILMLNFFENQVENAWCADDLNAGGVSIEIAGEYRAGSVTPTDFTCAPNPDLIFTPNGPHPCEPEEDLAFDAICTVMQRYQIPWTQIFQHEASNGTHTDPVGDEWVEQFIERIRDNCQI